MEQAVRPILKFILTPLIILSAFFQSILLKIENSENEKLYYGHTIVQVIYSLSISFSSGIVISFIINLILNYRYKSIDLKLNSLIWIPCFILVILIWIVLLNYKDVEFNLPKLILSTCGLLVEVDLKFRFWESIASVMVISGISCYFLIKVLSSYTIYNIDSYSTVVLIFCFFISLIIYSESTKDTLMRSIRQCILWVSLFIGFTFLTIYQIDEYVIQGKLLENGISISVSILGMALTMPTIIDKIRIFYNNAYSKYEKDIEEYLFIKTNKYSISRLYVFLKEKFKNLEIKYNIIKFLWITDQKDKVVIIVLVCLLIPMVFYVIEKFEIVLMN